MAGRDSDESHVDLTPELVVRAYCVGAFPMSDARDGEIRWYSPDPRALLPLEEESFKVSRSLRRRVNSGCYRVTMNRAFERVIRACAEPRPSEAQTWINDAIIDVYCQLHAAGLAHSVEAWAGEGDPELVGGLYGVSLGGAFFGESMFHRATDASKVCLVKLVEHLRDNGFSLLDVQFVNPHLEQFGVYEISRDEYLERLEQALNSGARW
jgi:leucyl/phenylalanyl-tRNA--protein transferase